MRVFIISIACILLMASCKKSNTSSANNSLVGGTWVLIETQSIGSAWTPVSTGDRERFTFNADSSLSYSPSMVSSLMCTGNFNTSRDTLTMVVNCAPGPTYPIMVVYSVNGNVLTMDHIATSSGYRARYSRE